jgi:lipoprotein-anchoring transpeptidase ErfK/SrfK
VKGRKHAPARGRRLRHRLLILLAVVGFVLVALGGASYAGYRYDRARAARILPGVRIAGVDVGDMTRQQAERAIRGAAAVILDRVIEVRAGRQGWTVTSAEMGTKVDVTGAVAQALAVSNSYAWPSRVYHRLFDKPVAGSIRLSVSYDEATVHAFVQKVAAGIKTAPQDAKLDWVDGQLFRQRSHAGKSIRVGRAAAALMATVKGSASSVELRVRSLKPAVTEKTLGLTIIIRRSQNKLYLYDGLKVVKVYGVATGQLGIYDTPEGHWEIVNKRINPTWINPAKDTWGKDEPDFIPPGPDNPLGTRAMDLNATGIRIHGTPSDSTIGHWASHGCIRMHIPDAEELFDQVEIGTPVIIVW